MLKFDDKKKVILANNTIDIVEDDKPEKCIDCPLNRVCVDAFGGPDVKLTKSVMNSCECVLEIEGRYAEKRKLFNDWQSYVDNDPKYFMERMMITQKMIEKEAFKDFSFAKGMQLQYMNMAIHRLKFGEKREINTQNVSASVDIKALMDKVRDK